MSNNELNNRSCLLWLVAFVALGGTVFWLARKMGKPEEAAAFQIGGTCQQKLDRAQIACGLPPEMARGPIPTRGIPAEDSEMEWKCKGLKGEDQSYCAFAVLKCLGEAMSDYDKCMLKKWE